MQTIIASIILACLAGMALAGPIYVDAWPKRVNVPDGVAHDPTPAQCRAAGYELRVNRPQSEIDAEAAQATVAASNASVQAAAWQAQQTTKSNMVQAVRGKYYSTTKALCREAGVAETNVLTSAQIEALVLPLLDDAETNAKVKRNNKVVAYMVQLEFLSRVLEREDGTDALDRL